jgi:hypothetical protein
MSKAPAQVDFELHNAVVTLVQRARAENRTLSAQREAVDILHQFPKSSISLSELEGLILNACSKEPGASIEFGG